MIRSIKVILASLIVLCASCASLDAKEHKGTESSQVMYTACKDPRPEICTREYKPVCATKLNEIRCVKAPCPSTEEVSYPTDCTACADPKVLKYKKGACH